MIRDVHKDVREQCPNILAQASIAIRSCQLLSERWLVRTFSLALVCSCTVRERVRAHRYNNVPNDKEYAAFVLVLM
jgi:hypothetical protein